MFGSIRRSSIHSFIYHMNKWTIMAYSYRSYLFSFSFSFFSNYFINKFSSFLTRYFQDASQRVTIVVALYPFKAIEGGDLSLEKVSSLIPERMPRSQLMQLFGQACVTATNCFSLFSFCFRMPNMRLLMTRKSIGGKSKINTVISVTFQVIMWNQKNYLD